MALIYKIISSDGWQQACAEGVFKGASIDLADGYIHLSDASQVAETARRHFAAQTNLLLVAYEADELADVLRWEASRGGAMFPHVYGPLNPAKARWAKPLPWKGAAHEFPEGVLL